MTDTNPQVPVEEDNDLLEAVRGLTREVIGLRNRLDTLYAPREEVKRESRRRAWRFLGFAVVFILIAQMLTMSTISYCFLDSGRQSADSKFCSLMPGYDQAVSQGADRIARFESLLTGIEETNQQAKDNKKRLDDIERRLSKLEKQQ